MNKFLLLVAFVALSVSGYAQTNPAVTNWLINTTGIQGSHYAQGNPTPIQDNVEANVQTVQYSASWAYVSTNGIPAYITGPFLDGNPSIASNQNAIFKIPLNPVKNNGTPTPTNGGNIGIFVNGVALFDYRDGVAWNSTNNSLCGGPGNPPCPGGPMATNNWNRDAVPAERNGFDCAKAHPAMGNYHHHQNPSAFNLDLMVVSNICDLYPADGLYAIDPNQHAPLIGFAYDGFPIYGAYGYKNTDGTGGIVRIKSGYHKRNITERTLSPTGVDVPDGPPVSTTYPLGYFREDYEFVASTEPDYLDAHNGRFCVTPEYPQGTYAYFCTVDENYNSTYPYVVGPTFYGTVTGAKVNSITEPVSTYNPSTAVFGADYTALNVTVYPNPAADFIAVQFNGLLKAKASLRLYNLSGELISETSMPAGTTIGYFQTRTLYNGVYLVQISAEGKTLASRKVVVNHN